MAPVTKPSLILHTDNLEGFPPITPCMLPIDRTDNARTASSFDRLCDVMISRWRVAVIVLSCLSFLLLVICLFLLGRVIVLQRYLRKDKHLKKEEKKRLKKAKHDKKGKGKEHFNREAGPSDINKSLPPLPRSQNGDPEGSKNADSRADGDDLIDMRSIRTPIVGPPVSSSSRASIISGKFSKRFDKGKGVDRSGIGEAGPSNQGLVADDGGSEPDATNRKPGWIAAYFTGPAWSRSERSEK